ncbi:MAG: hypothetical protein E3K37_11840 [Candidatus Kuenenia sp.]|nr:hypothetical protein [Candidatus Kuenenia hertensis]
MIDLEKIKEITTEILNDPEYFILNKYYGKKSPKGFRIELFLARKFNQLHNTLKRYEYNNYIKKGSRLGERIPCSISFKRVRKLIDGWPSKKKQETAFCRYCERRVVPVRIHKLDFGDVMLIFFTAGVWGILLFFMYLFMRRCPYCNHSLRKLRPLSEGNDRR